MRIGGNLQPYMMTRTRTQTAAQKSSSGRPACTTNSPLSDITVQPDGGVSSMSPYMRLCDSYERWKAQMTGKQDPLPDSKGLTEENIAYLKEHYSGELGWEERVDVLNTMQEMGILGRDGIAQACGGGLVSISLDQMKQVSQTALSGPITYTNPWETRWDVLFKGEPIAGFRTLDDILAWVDKVVDKTDKPQEVESVVQEQEPVTTQELLEMRG